MTNETSPSFLEQLDTSPWSWLKPHNERGALILVDGMLDLVTVAERVACDDSAAVQSWLASRLLSKPTAEQIEAWNTVPEKMFTILVVSPFVLMQEVSSDHSDQNTTS